MTNATNCVVPQYPNLKYDVWLTRDNYLDLTDVLSVSTERRIEVLAAAAAAVVAASGAAAEAVVAITIKVVVVGIKEVEEATVAVVAATVG